MNVEYIQQGLEDMDVSEDGTMGGAGYPSQATERKLLYVCILVLEIGRQGPSDPRPNANSLCARIVIWCSSKTRQEVKVHT